MKGGINKMKRKIAAFVATGSDYEEKLFEATYNGDTKEPKEEYLIYLQECFMDIHEETIDKEDAIRIFIERHKNKVNDFVTNTKSFIILHRSLTNEKLGEFIANEIMAEEKHLGFFSLIETSTDDQKMMQELFKIQIASQYSKYVKTLAKSMVELPIIKQTHIEADKNCENMNTSNIIEQFEGVNCLITQIVSIMVTFGIENASINPQDTQSKDEQKQNNPTSVKLAKYAKSYMGKYVQLQEYCVKQRLFNSMIKLLFQDMLNHYQIQLILMTELIRRFAASQVKFTAQQQKQLYYAYQAFVDQSFQADNLCKNLIIRMKYTISQPAFFFKQKEDLDKQLLECFIAQKDPQEVFCKIKDEIETNTLSKVTFTSEQMLELDNQDPQKSNQSEKAAMSLNQDDDVKRVNSNIEKVETPMKITNVQKAMSVKKPEPDNDFFNFDLPDPNAPKQEIADFFQLDDNSEHLKKAKSSVQANIEQDPFSFDFATDNNVKKRQSEIVQPKVPGFIPNLNYGQNPMGFQTSGPVQNPMGYGTGQAFGYGGYQTGPIINSTYNININYQQQQQQQQYHQQMMMNQNYASGSQTTRLTPNQIKQMQQYQIEQEMWNMDLNKK